MNPYFKKWYKYFKNLNRKIKIENLSVKKLTLSRLNREKTINSFIVGISNTNQLREISDILKNKKDKLLKEIDIPNIEDQNLINPRYWKLR